MATLGMIFSVEDYGAVHDGVINDSGYLESGTDDTNAIQSAINACLAAGGGTVYFPNGIYVISGPLITSLDGVNPNCQIYFPLQQKNNQALTTITLQGETTPSRQATMLSNTKPVTTGAILWSTITGSGTKPAVIGSSFYNTGIVEVNSITAVLKDLRVRVKSMNTTTHIAPTMSGVNAYSIEQFKAFDLICDTESDSWESVLPTSQECIGIVTPRTLNGGVSVLSHCMTKNYYTGFQIDEHCYAEDIRSDTSVINIHIIVNAAAHITTINKCYINGGINHVKITGPVSGFATIYVERWKPSIATKWYTTTYDFELSSMSTASLMEINYLIQGEGGIVAPLFSNSVNGSIFRNLATAFSVFTNTTGVLTGAGEYQPIINLRSWNAVSGDTYMPDIYMAHKQNGTGTDAIGRILFINELSAQTDKRLFMFSARTNGSKEKGLGREQVHSGTSLTTVREISSDKIEHFVPVKLRSYTVSGVPSASTSGAGSMIFVTDESGGAVVAFSDGTDWRRVTDRAVIS